MPDPIFSNPRLASLYDIVDDDRSDLDVYLAIVDELGADSVLDIGCGTGTLACRLASAGKQVIGLDPAEASLRVARDKAHAERVRWVHGDASSLPEIQVDLVVMTGNVAMVFLDDAEWMDVLASARRSLRPGGWLVFESRDPSRRDWERWRKNDTLRSVEAPSVGRVDTWTDLTDVRLPLVSFRHTFRFHDVDEWVVSDSTLRFRARQEITKNLADVGIQLREVRDAPDRPGLEHVYFTQGARRVT